MSLSQNWKSLKGVKRKKTSDENSTEEKALLQNDTKKRIKVTTGQSALRQRNSIKQLLKQEAEVTSCVALDCEMVGGGPTGQDSLLARCSIINYDGQVLYDKYVRPAAKITDYRTWVSGIEARHLFGPTSDAIPFAQCKREVHALLQNRVLVGHALAHDLKVLELKYPPRLIRDTSTYKVLCPLRPKSLKTLVKDVLGIDIQQSAHNSVEDARCVLAIYKRYRKDWEKHVYNVYHSKQKKIMLKKKSKSKKAEKKSLTK